jgi:hypothetical protein
MIVGQESAEARVRQYFDSIGLQSQRGDDAAPQPGPHRGAAPSSEEPHSSSSARVDPDGAEAMDDDDSPGPAVQLEGSGNESNVRAGADCMETDGAMHSLVGLSTEDEKARRFGRGTCFAAARTALRSITRTA